MLVIAVIAALIASFVWSRTVTSLALSGWSALGDAHWTERARIAWPIVVDRVFLVAGLPAVACACAMLAGLGTLDQGLVALGAMAGAALGTRDGQRRIFPGISTTSVVKSRLVRLLGYLPLMLAGVSALLPFSPLVVAALAIVHVVWTYGFVRLLRVTGLASGYSDPDIVVVPGATPNACAFPLTNEILVADSLLALDAQDVEAILAHERGHLAEPRAAKRARAALSWFWLPLPFTALFVARELVWLEVALVALPLMLSTVIAQKLEAMADAWAAARVPAADLARALEKVHAISYTPAVMTSSATHPSLWSRMHEAGVTPDWPRPEPPRRGIGALSIIAALVAVVFALAVT